jgi:hypothetical protein
LFFALAPLSFVISERSALAAIVAVVVFAFDVASMQSWASEAAENSCFVSGHDFSRAESALFAVGW